MRSTILLCCVAVAAVACSKSDNTPAADTQAAATPAPPPAPAPIKLSDVAGTWDVTGKNETGDSTLITYSMTMTADTSGWSIKFKDRAKPVPVHVVAVEGDSIVIAAGPYPSVLRKGVQVSTRGAIRMHGDMLMGTTTAHYSVKTADSVRVVKLEGTRSTATKK
jgi:hypothetical protein